MNSIVLVISPQPELRRLIRKTIQATCDVFEFESADSALRLFPIIAQRSKLIFFDFDSGMRAEGITLLRQFRNIHPMVALVPIVRAESEFALIQRMKEVDIYEVVRPPFKTDIISLVAHRALTANDVNAELFRGKEVLPSGNFTASFSVKVQLLQDLVNRKSGCGESVLMDDIYGFFPELRKSEIPGDRMVRDTDIEHGILLFIYDLQDRIWR